MSNTSVRSYATEHINNVGVTENTPFELAAAWEEIFLRPSTVPFNRNTTREQLLEQCRMVHLVEPQDACFSASAMEQFKKKRRLIDMTYKLRERKFLAFGCYGMEDDEKTLFKECGKGLADLDEQVTAISYAIEKVKSRKAWKAEQNRHRQPAAYADMDGMTTDLPPLDPPHCKIITRLNRTLKIPMRLKKAADKLGYGVRTIHAPKTHTPAIYQIKMAGRPMHQLEELQNCGPDAMREFAKWLKHTPVGGDTATLNQMLGTKKIEWTDEHDQVRTAWPWIATYSSELIDGTWFVTVSRKRNPVCTPSSYWATERGELTRNNPNRYKDKETGETCYLEPGHADYQAPLTLSQLDYHLLCESSDLEVQDEFGETVDYMNEEEEFLTSFPLRDTDETFIDYKKFCEDDVEMALFNECSNSMERSETGITEGELESQQFVMHLHREIKEAQARLDVSLPLVKTDADITEQDELDVAAVKKYTWLDSLWNSFIGCNKSNVLTSYWYPNVRHRMHCMSHPNHAKGIPREIAGASTMPDNLITPQKIVKGSRTRYVNRKTISCTLNDAKQMRRQKRVCRAIIGNRFGLLIREKAAAIAFETSFDAAISTALRA